MLVLPRSARLAAWGTAVLAGEAGTADAVSAVSGDDEPHRVLHAEVPSAGAAAHPGALPLPEHAGLAELLAALRSAGAAGLRVVLPTAGDVLGLPGPPWFNEVALEAGECAIAEAPRREPEVGSAGSGSAGSGSAWSGGTWALVPQVTEFGSEWEPGAMVTWHLYAVPAPRVTGHGSIAEADQELRVALHEATGELARLDVARWRDDAAHRLAAIRGEAVDPGLLPPATPQRCLRVLAAAARVRAIVELAAEDDGGAVTGFEAGARAQALRGLDRVSRRALVAAVNGWLES